MKHLVAPTTESHKIIEFVILFSMRLSISIPMMHFQSVLPIMPFCRIFPFPAYLASEVVSL